MIIKKGDIEEIKDSRGEPTIAVSLWAEDASAESAVPSGKSRGRREAVPLSPPEAKLSLAEAERKGIFEREYFSIKEFDAFLREIDPSPRKEIIGGNVSLGLSLSFAKLLAKEKEQEMWETIREEYFANSIGYLAPYIFSNVINGGLHAKDGLDIQEYMIAVKPHEPFEDGVTKLAEFYKALGILLSEREGGQVQLGDEAGYSAGFRDNEGPLFMLSQMIAEGGYEKDFALAIDVAAGSFRREDFYLFGGEEKNREEMLEIYSKYAKDISSLIYIEDPFAEDDEDGFTALRSGLPDHLIVGDDLTVTNHILIEESAKSAAINGVIIKPNQIGTLSETCEAILTARQHGVKEIISHRSGETEDVSIIQIAKACGAFGVKIGAPARERLLKYRELLRLYGSGSMPFGIE